LAAAIAPLSHHQILELVAPFSRAGCALDLAGSDRAERQLVFKPVLHAAASGLPAMTEHLTLQAVGHGWALTRRLLADDGLQASLLAEGADPAELLAAVQRVPPTRQFMHAVDNDTASSLAALHHRIGQGGALVLREARARVAGLTLKMKVSSVKGYPAHIDLLRGDGDTRRLPDDLLEVQGRAWTRLTELRLGWEASVQLRGSEPQRSADAQLRLCQTLAHLQATLSAPPTQFHERHRAARWRVGLARGGPLMLGVLLVAAAFAVRGRGDGSEAALAALANLAPPLLMALFFMRREMPRIELPRWPRRLPPSSWQPWNPPQ